MKLAHISDLHLDIFHKKHHYEKAVKVLEYISGIGCDHIMITGDLTENADREAFELARKLLKKHNLLDSSKLSIIIGNHDIYGGVHFAEDLIHFPNKCRNTKYDQKISEFAYFFREAFYGTKRPDKTCIFPFLKELDELIIIGINTISRYSMLRNPFASNGTVSKGQLSFIDELLLNCKSLGKRKIALSHHHFTSKYIKEENAPPSFWNRIERHTMKLHRRTRLFKLFKKHKVDLILHGHTHESVEYSIDGMRFLNGGGTTLGIDPEKIAVNLIDISPDKISTKIETVNYCSTSLTHDFTKVNSNSIPVSSLIYSELCLN